MAYFRHVVIWPSKSSLTPNSEKVCDVTARTVGAAAYIWLTVRDYAFNS